MDTLAHLVANDDSLFKPDPQYASAYDAESNLDTYGAKHPDRTARPAIELGKQLYEAGPIPPGINLFGSRNLVFPQLLAYGDWRTAVAYNDNGGVERGVLATKLNMDVDLRITATERIHAFFTPQDQNGVFTRYEFAGKNQHSQFVTNGIPGSLFFEGDLARIAAGVTGRENKLDIPFTFGLIPLITQNGVWLEDAFDGFAITIPARNSPHLDISNMDITFFAGFDHVDTPAIPDNDDASVFGVAAFIEANRGYWEFGYGYTLGRDRFADLSYSNISLAFTRRYFDTISNSVRVIYNFGQNPDPGQTRTANGGLIILENSLITPLPLTLVPYLNLFAGFDTPQSLARGNGTGGVLINTGITFETDGLTGFPKLDDTGHNTYGGALGIEYLFNIDQQIVLEMSGLNTFGDATHRTAKGSEFGLGARYQLPLNNAWILRSDIIFVDRDQAQNSFGVRLELRRKF